MAFSSATNGHSSDSITTNVEVPKLPISDQLQKLEMLFLEFKILDEKQIEQWSLELEMDPDLINYWFQSKILEIQVANEEKENNALRMENARIQLENIKLSEQLTNFPPCQTCMTKIPVFKLELLRENIALEEEKILSDFLLLLEDPAFIEHQKDELSKNEETEDPSPELDLPHPTSEDLGN